MENIPWYESAGKMADAIRPTGIYAYVDSVRGWAEPFTRAEQHYLRQQCETLYAPAPCRRPWQRDPREQQYFDLTQPSDAAYQCLANIPGVRFNYAEFKLEWVFKHEDERDQANSFFNQYAIKRWHRQSQGIRVVNGVTRYTAGRQATSNLASYADRPSKVTGEVACVQIEFRVQRQRSLQRLGIKSAKDLIHFDHRGFWKERLLLRSIDVLELGRAYNRQVLGRGPRYGGWESYDQRVGESLALIGGSTQHVIDHYRRYGDMKAWLVEVDNGRLLPEVAKNRGKCRGDRELYAGESICPY